MSKTQQVETTQHTASATDQAAQQIAREKAEFEAMKLNAAIAERMAAVVPTYAPSCNGRNALRFVFEETVKAPVKVVTNVISDLLSDIRRGWNK